MWSRERYYLLLVLAITVGGAWIRLSGFAERPVWEDDSYTWNDSQTSLPRLFMWKGDPQHGPFSHILVRTSMLLFDGKDAWILRLPSLVCGILCIPAGYLLGRNAHSPLLGLNIALLVMVDLNVVDQSQQARMYTMLSLFCLLALGLAIPLLEQPPPTRARWIGLGVVLSLAFWTHFSAISLWVGLAITVSWRLWPHWRGGQLRSNPLARGMLITYAVAVLLSSRGLWKFAKAILRNHSDNSTSVTEAVTSIGDALVTLVDLQAASIVVYLLSILGLVVLYLRSPVAAQFLCGFGIVALALVLRVRLTYPVFAHRYLTTFQPVFWVGLGMLPCALAWLPWRALAIPCFLAGILAQSHKAMQIEQWTNLDEWYFFREAAALVHGQRHAGELFSCAPRGTFLMLARYYDLMSLDDEQLDVDVFRAPRAQIQPSSGTWIVSNPNAPAGEQELQHFLTAVLTPRAAGARVQVFVRQLQSSGRVVLHVESSTIRWWTFNPEKRLLERSRRIDIGRLASRRPVTRPNLAAKRDSAGAETR